MSHETVKRNRYYDPGPPEQTADHESKNHYEDFHDFHLPLERMHNSNLHDWGIASSLEVIGTIGGTEIKVNAGVAIDIDGHLISLSEHGYIGKKTPQGEDYEVPGGSNNEAPVPVSLKIDDYKGKTVYVTIQFSQILRSTEGVLGRLEQVPWVRLQPDTDPFDSKAIVLAIAVIDANGKLAEIKTSDSNHRRKLIGESIEELRIQRSSKIGDQVQDILSGKIGPVDTGGLKITVPDAQDSVLFAKEDGNNFANLEIRANVDIKTKEAGTALSVSKADTESVIRAQTVTSGNSMLSLLNDGNQEYQIVANRASNRLEITSPGTVGLMMGFDPNSGNVGMGTSNPVPNAKLDLQGGGLNIGGSGNLDAAIHVKSSYGGFDRLLQMSPTGASKPGLNLLASRDANNNEQWWVWGVDKDNTWKIQPGTDFSGESGLSIDPSGTIRLFRKNAFQGHDLFLRINQDNEFPSGTHFAHRANFAAGITTGNWWEVEPGWGNLLVQGKVGIGVQAPSENLEVVGNIRMHPVSTGAGPIPLRSLISRIIVGDGDQAKALEFSRSLIVFPNTIPNSIKVGNGWSFSAPSKNFLIDHPLHPDTHELVHSTLEGPEIAVFYRGEGQLSNGETTVSLPDYFEALTRKENRTVLLTPKFEEGTEVSILAASEVKDGKFTVVKMAESKNSSQKFYWEVKAVRADIGILEVERIKTQLRD